MFDIRRTRRSVKSMALVALVSSAARAQTAPPPPGAPPSPVQSAPPAASAPEAPESPAPAAPPEEQTPPKVAQPLPSPAPAPSPESPPKSPTPPPARTDVSFAARATGASREQAEDENTGAGEPVSRKTRGSELSLELGGAFQAGAHFPEDSERRSVEEAIDSAFGLGAWLIPRSTWALGLAVEHIGLGKDHYATDSRGQTMTAAYAVDTLWIGGRLYFSDERPAFYIGLAAGPALPRARATGTRATDAAFTRPPQPFQCSATGGVGGAAGAAAGVEFDIGDAWSFVSEARFTAHFLDKSAAAFDGCAPGSGTALSGSLRIGFAYRFQI